MTKPSIKILLIQPPIQDFYETRSRIQPVGLCYVASSLRAKIPGIMVEILDAHAEGGKTTCTIPEEFGYLQNLYGEPDTGPFKVFNRYFHFGMSYSAIRTRLAESSPDIVGISSIFSPYYRESLKIARVVKEINPETVVVMGGSHVTCRPWDFLGSDYVDYIITGEGEEAFTRLVHCLMEDHPDHISRIPGAGYKTATGYNINEPAPVKNLDVLPYPALDLLDLDRYQYKNKRITSVITGRGCAFRCEFCSIPQLFGHRMRMRSLENILDEMERDHDQYGIEVFDFEDENFAFDPERAGRLCRMIIKRFGKKKLTLTAMNGVHYWTLTKDLLSCMETAGFEMVNLSLVSSNTQTSRSLGRNLDLETFRETSTFSAEKGMLTIGYNIIGMPGQTISEMTDTFINLMELPLLLGTSIFYMTPGTPIEDRIRSLKNIEMPDDVSYFARSTAVWFQTEEFNRLDIITFFLLSRIINCLKGYMDKLEINGVHNLSNWFSLVNTELYDPGKNGIEIKYEGRENRMHVDMSMLATFFHMRKVCMLVKEKGGKRVLMERPVSDKVVAAFFEKNRERKITSIYKNRQLRW